jgi:hypothetical protein
VARGTAGTGRVRKQFFFEKKNQKTFVRAVADSMDKSFLLLFFKKEGLAFAHHAANAFAES